MTLHRAPSLGCATDRLNKMKNLEKNNYYGLQYVTDTHIIGLTIV